MNNFLKKFILLFFIMSCLTQCQTLREGLEGSKKGKNAEEFLIDKKNPLTLPPDFSELPTPKDITEEENKSNEIDVEQILKKNSLPKKKENNSVKKNSLENSVLDKIKK